jgi:hypothetical protein
MTDQTAVQAILNVDDGLFGLRYLKIVKSPTGPHFIVDVMFKRGLRLTSNIEPGYHVSNIGKELDEKARFYRSSDYDNIKPAIDFVSECAGRVLSDENGRVAECQLHADVIRQAWEMTRFRRFVKVIDPSRKLEFEQTTADLKALYAAGPSEPSLSWSSDVQQS